jgi:hypothetical protein
MTATETLSQTRHCLLVVTLSLLFVIPVQGQQRADLEQMTVGRFEVNETSIPEALLKLGEDSRVPLGIVATDPELWKQKVSLRAENAGFTSVLGRILSGASGYRWHETQGVVVIANPDLHTAVNDSLYVTIPVFETSRPQAPPNARTAEAVSTKLWMTLLLHLDPQRKEGFMGVLHPSDLDRELPSVDLGGHSVEEILNWIVSRHGAAAWVAMPFLGDIQKAQVGQLWKIFFYGQPPSKSKGN